MNISSDNQKVLSTAALVLSVIILVGALGLALWPLPTTAAQISAIKRKSAEALAAGKKAKLSADTQHAATLQATWSGTGIEIGPNAYASLNKIANGLHIKIEGIRAQRTTDAGDVSQLPYVVNAQGSFQNMVRFVNTIETPPSKLAVELFQMGAADESTDQVTATIGLEAYVLNAPLQSTTAKTSSATTNANRVQSSTGLTGPGPRITAKPITTIHQTEIDHASSQH